MVRLTYVFGWKLVQNLRLKINPKSFRISGNLNELDLVCLESGQDEASNFLHVRDRERVHHVGGCGACDLFIRTRKFDQF
jgi:hypothetical protein